MPLIAWLDMSFNNNGCNNNWVAHYFSESDRKYNRKLSRFIILWYILHHDLLTCTETWNHAQECDECIISHPGSHLDSSLQPLQQTYQSPTQLAPSAPHWLQNQSHLPCSYRYRLHHPPPPHDWSKKEHPPTGPPSYGSEYIKNTNNKWNTFKKYIECKTCVYFRNKVKI